MRPTSSPKGSRPDRQLRDCRRRARGVRTRGSSPAEVVDQVGQQRDAARGDKHNGLGRGGERQDEQRPADGHQPCAGSARSRRPRARGCDRARAHGRDGSCSCFARSRRRRGPVERRMVEVVPDLLEQRLDVPVVHAVEDRAPIARVVTKRRCRRIRSCCEAADGVIPAAAASSERAPSLMACGSGMASTLDPHMYADSASAESPSRFRSAGSSRSATALA
jgi:hypothetical protein